MYYHVEKRYNYYAVDKYTGSPHGSYIGTLDTFRTRKQANIVAAELNRIATYATWLENEHVRKQLNENKNDSHSHCSGSCSGGCNGNKNCSH